ncbi:MAG: apolipoprotein N-acyltransferase [Mailhella sp.]|nr:apolipoprotein N-acyltransferase [Mailhella sp.]
MRKDLAEAVMLSFAASAAVFLGTANPVVHVPFLIMLLPAVLHRIAVKGDAPFCSGAAAALPGTAAALYWIAVAAEHYGGMPWMLAVPCSIALGACVCLWNGAWTWAMARLRGLPPLKTAAAAALLWYFSEWTRSWVMTGFPWLTLSSGLAAWPALLQPLSLLGEFGYSGILAGTAVLAADPRMHAFSSRTLRHAAVPAALVLVLGAWSAWRFAWMADSAPLEGRPVDVVLCQGNIRQDVKWTPAYKADTLRKYELLTLSALGEGPEKPDLILWPETAMPFIYPGTSPFPQELRRFAAGSECTVVFGSLGSDGSGRLLRNSAFAVSAEGDIGRSDKRHLVPFGEYLPPVLDWEVFAGLLQGLGGFSPGEGDGILRLPLRRGGEAAAGMLICYEAVFPEIAREQAASGAELLLNISNDAWYDRTSAPMQHLQLSLMRAVEQGRFLCRATNTGMTAVADPLGRLEILRGGAGAPMLFESGMLRGRVLALRSHTPYFYLHPWLPLLAAAALAALLPALRGRRPRSAAAGHFRND